MDLVPAYLVYQKMMRYPHIIQEMRQIFVSALEKKGIINAEEIERQAVQKCEQADVNPSADMVREYTNALIDIYFANNFTEEEIENHINLARKNDSFKHLRKAVNTEGATTEEIQQALIEFCRIPQGNMFISPNEAEGTRVALINHFISDQLPFIGIAKNHITIRDIEEIVNHSYWNPRRSGKVGGKAAGMLLAYKIVCPRLEEGDPELEKYVTIPESYYFSSGTFNDYIDYNSFDHFYSHKYKSREELEKGYKNIAEFCDNGSFPPDIMNQFRDLLGKVGENPLILRSSTLLEDNFGHAFSGKYDSVFVANQGDFETRLKEFIRGMLRVQMSIFSPAPILYRREHNLLDFDERMGVLVQKVVGRRFGKYFFPAAAGVAYSYNVYNWTPRIKKEDGLVRLVVGMGTRAVNRVSSDYPRMIPLSHPHLRPEVEAGQIKKYSQKMVDILNVETGLMESISYRDLFQVIEHPDLYYMVSVSRDGHLAPPMFKAQAIDPDQACITFDNLLDKSPFVGLMKKILTKLEKEYGRPVDVEFAWDDGKLYILQCRSLPLKEETRKIAIPANVPRERILFTNDRSVSNSIVKDIEFIVYVDPKAYGRLATRDEKIAVGRVVSKINQFMEEKRYILLGPGRWGSNDINLGVKVGYEDINRTLVLGEISFEEDGSTPEVSYGTHFFNDLVEAHIVHIAVFPDEPGITFKEDFFLTKQNQLKGILPDMASFTQVVHVIHVPSSTEGRLLQIFQDGHNQRGIGFCSYSDEFEEQASPYCEI